MKRYSLATAFFAALFLAESFAGGKLTAYGAGGTWMENGAGAGITGGKTGAWPKTVLRISMGNGTTLTRMETWYLAGVRSAIRCTILKRTAG